MGAAEPGHDSSFPRGSDTNEERTMTTHSRGRSRRPLSGVTAGALLIGGVLTTGCGDLFVAENPANLNPENLENPSMLDPLTTGTTRVFDLSRNNMVEIGGLLSDEMIASGTWPSYHMASRLGIIDLDASAGNVPNGIWNNLHEARFLGRELHRLVQAHAPNPGSDRRAALGKLYEGIAIYDLTTFFCQQTYDSGPAMTSGESLGLSEEALTAAIQIAQSAGDADILALAHLGRARARLVRGDLSGAAGDAQAVPDGFTWWSRFSLPDGITMGFWNQSRDRNEITVDVAFRDTDDPRVPVTYMNGLTGADRETEVWRQEKYQERDSNIRSGSWQEARLIEAETLLEGPSADVSGAIALMNQVRAAADLEALSPGVSAEQAREFLRAERKHELWLEGGTRYGDMRRWGLFPSGWGASCIPFPRPETDSNPNIQRG